MAEAFNFEPIAYIASPFKEKFGIPRQAGLAAAARGTITLLPDYADPHAVDELAGFSHLWLIYVFHRHVGQGWQARVRPPRLGGNRRVGVFASRAPYRPNPLGLSVVKLEDVQCDAGGVTLTVSGIDLLDGTPILDIKPYIPYSDAITEARAHYAGPIHTAPVSVRFSEAALQRCRQLETAGHPQLRVLIEQVLQQDPRPAYRGAGPDDNRYGFRLFDFDVRFHSVGDGLVVDDIVVADDSSAH
jgi:tRNA-Thr(GGU) m(6)t(6)A37 methyltransferase TsaA